MTAYVKKRITIEMGRVLAKACRAQCSNEALGAREGEWSNYM